MNDFEKLSKYINKYCKLKCKSTSKEYSGWVYTIDPVSLSVVLIEFDDEFCAAKKAHVIMKDEITAIEEASNDQSDSNLIIDLFNNIFNNKLFNLNEASESAGNYEDLAEKRKNLINWLEKNRIPINKSNDEIINIMDTVFIHKPYNVENCESTNEIILNKIYNLVKQFNASDK